jgi:ATP-dependent Clp protease protease subunit
MKFWKIQAKEKKTGELTLYGVIDSDQFWGDETTPKVFKEELDGLGEIDTLNVYINSPGGDVFAGQAIYSILKRHPARKAVYIDGVAGSIASVVAMAGDVIKMPKNAMMMVHNPMAGCFGFAQDLRKRADDLDHIRESMLAAYQSKVTKLTRDEIIALLDAETWMTAEEAVEKGFADEVIREVKAAACAGIEYLAKYRNVPKSLIEASEEEVRAERDRRRRKLALAISL